LLAALVLPASVRTVRQVVASHGVHLGIERLRPPSTAR